MKKVRESFFWILLVFLAIGIFYPIIGFLAIICMFAPILVAPFKGRYWCGNFCPRGSFYDYVMAKLSPNKTIPAFFRSTALRIFMVLFIMGLFSVQMYNAWGDLSAMGAVFVRIVFLTTLVGIVLAMLYHPRTWCSFCPIGTLASWVSSRTKPAPMMVQGTCVNCKLCTITCPMQLSPYTAKGSTEGFVHNDCLKCSRCVEKCPKKALNF